MQRDWLLLLALTLAAIPAGRRAPGLGAARRQRGTEEAVGVSRAA